MDLIPDEIYILKKLKLFCNKSVLKKVLKKSCKGCTFLADGRLIRQVNWCSMGDPISVIVSNISCVKMECNIVK